MCATVRAMPTLEEIEAQLSAPGAPFETAEEDVLGERLVVFKDRRKSLREVLAASEAFADKEYLVFDSGTRITFGRHIELVASLARSLQDRYGIEKGDRVAILAANSPEWILTFWAAVSLGAIAVGMNAWWAGDEIRYALGDAEPRVLVADSKRLGRLAGLDPGVPIVRIDGGDGGPTFGDETAFGDLAADTGGVTLPDVPIAEDDPAVILYTSGTTGRAKGVVNSHRNIIALTAVQISHGLSLFLLAPPKPPEEGGPEVPAQRVQLVGNPLFHVSGLYTHVVTMLVTGTKTVWTTGRYDPETVLRLIETERVTGWSPMGSMAPRLVEHPAVGDYDLSSVLTMGSGGSPMPEHVQRRLREVFPNAAASLGVGYGQTECTALATLCSGKDLEAHPRSVGRPLPTVEVEIRDPAGNVLPDGEEGEICIRGPLVMLEYWRNPEATADVLDAHRWLRTGDIGRLEHGFLTVNTRARDLILRAGENVYPAEIELRLAAHPDVHEAAVVGVDHPTLGQEVKAIVVPADAAAPPDHDTLATWVGETLAYYKVPSLWELRTERLPRNAAGKVQKPVLLGEDANPFVAEDDL
ncbi:MAG: acyl--CoA ligase [Acidimicrobiia bacterium]|nr:acyl--CoA ligase [Acidimicrobiia bacterium]